MGHAATERSEIDNAAVALRLREEIARRRISRQGLADTARLSMSTLEKALAGRRRFTLATVVRLEQALGASLREESTPDASPPAATSPSAIPGLAPLEMGSYARPAVRWIEGSYVTLRPGFCDPQAIYAYRTRIRWNEEAGHLVFAESDRVDAGFEQAGFVSMPCLSGHIYLVTSVAGQYRMAMLGMAPRSMRLFGLLTTLQSGPGAQLTPTACPLAMVPGAQLSDISLGVVRPGEAGYAALAEILSTSTEGGFAEMAQPKLQPRLACQDPRAA